MLRSLTARAIVPVAVAVTGFVIVCCILLYSVMKTDMVNDAVSYEANLADTIIKSTRYAMLKSDRETVSNIIDNIGSQDGIEHVRIFNKKGLIMFSQQHEEINRYVDKKTAGCIGCHAGTVPHATMRDMERARRFVNTLGTEVIAITAPIYNEPACYTASCHFHTSGQKILGTLDIGLSATPLSKTLSIMRSRMMVFSIMVLILSVGGVAALLRRQVFMPLREIKAFTAKVNRGNLSPELSGISGELTELAGDIRAMASRLRIAVDELEKLRGGTEEMKEKAGVNANSV
ncbi:HAMP domain-containing protein [Geotalea uraniireducens]|uniref:Histidine kinase, HAMP region domain protein n=1 Tax=Geotalea uraniireducens (strain Rf4) TaxID=351605 RepID=A5G7P1_GEOUR|nr:HAMP domain-containing protein [Geotalea uraniireducens]ABQ27809.1 histidine kinase, HAMP region domain protein [Geotalea uraniireducens Rf4]